MGTNKKAAEVKVEGSSGTTRLPHTCHSPFQDRKYGKGVRVWNVGNTQVRCTVCGEEKRK
jgi:hypothetical protein